MIKKKTKIAIIGSSGFIGKYLLEKLSEYNFYEISIMIHKSDVKFKKNINIVNGSIDNYESLENLILNQDIVINLVNPKINIEKIAIDLLEICKIKKVKKLIHISTSEVFGPQKIINVNENSKCFPETKYQKNKILFEKKLYENFIKGLTIIILRPTIVFGIGGQNLLKTFNDIKNDNRFKTFFKKSLFHFRMLNLVSINYLIESIIFFLDKDFKKNELFIISQDHIKENNYTFVHAAFEKILKKKSISYYIKFNKSIIKLILRILGFSNINYNLTYDNSKIHKLGFKSKNSFTEELDKLGFFLKKNIN